MLGNELFWKGRDGGESYAPSGFMCFEAGPAGRPATDPVARWPQAGKPDVEFSCKFDRILERMQFVDAAWIVVGALTFHVRIQAHMDTL